MEEEIVSEDAKERDRTVLGDKRERKKEMEGGREKKAIRKPTLFEIIRIF